MTGNKPAQCRIRGRCALPQPHTKCGYHQPCTLDFNTEGMVHLGLVAELIEDVRRDGVTDEELEPLFKSAEGYIRVWEKSESRGQALSQ